MRNAESNAHQVAYWKWEFLRRNEGYCKDYKIRAEGNPRTKELLDYFQEKYGIGIPIAPATKPPIDFLIMAFGLLPVYASLPIESTLGPMLVKLQKDIDGMSGQSTAINLARARAVANLKEPSQKELANADVVQINVNLGYSKTQLLKEINRIIQEWQDRREKFKGKLSRKNYASAYKEYIDAYDLKRKYPKATNIELAVKLYKRKQIGREGEDKFRKQYEAASQLIEGDYRKITF